MKFTIRDYRPADFEAIFAIDQVCYSAEIAYSRPELAWYLHPPRGFGFVAEMSRHPGRPANRMQKHIVGFTIAATHAAYGPAKGHIITLDVLETHRRAGVGSALLERAEEELRRRSVAEVWLETATNNEPAIAFWKKHGYRSHGILPNYYPNRLDAFAMSKSFANSAPAERWGEHHE